MAGRSSCFFFVCMYKKDKRFRSIEMSVESSRQAGAATLAQATAMMGSIAGTRKRNTKHVSTDVTVWRGAAVWCNRGTMSRTRIRSLWIAEMV